MRLLSVGVAALAMAMAGVVAAEAQVQTATPEGNSTIPRSGSSYPNKGIKVTTDQGRVVRSMDDQAFVTKAVAGNMGEIDLAKLALQKSSNPQVKAFAEKMIHDHTQMGAQVKSVANTAGLKYTEQPAPKAKQMYAKLQGLNGAAFDKAWVDGMVADHKEDVQMFEAESQNGQVEPLMKAAANALPTIKEHLRIVEGLQKSGV